MECVQFNMSEDQIVTGSQSGSIRVWDMEAAKSKWGGGGGGQTKTPEWKQQSTAATDDLVMSPNVLLQETPGLHQPISNRFSAG